MSRMNAIRKLATSSAAYGATGAVAGAATAAYSGSDIMSGAMSGAAIGVGGRLGAGAMSGLKTGGSALIDRGLSRIGASGLTQSAKSRIGNAAGAVQMRMNRIGGKSMAMGALAGGGTAAYATLSSNGGESRYSQASLNERLNYHRSMKEMQMSYNLKESMMKKQIWRANK